MTSYARSHDAKSMSGACTCRQVLMRAVGVTEFGGPEALHVVDVPAEPLAPGQVRLRVEAATVNTADSHGAPVKAARGGPGEDVAGSGTEAPDGVDHGGVGDLVTGIVVRFGPHGGYREDKVLPGSSVVRVPAGVAAVAASTLPMDGL